MMPCGQSNIKEILSHVQCSRLHYFVCPGTKPSISAACDPIISLLVSKEGPYTPKQGNLHALAYLHDALLRPLEGEGAWGRSRV